LQDKIRILGIDPGIQVTGIGIIDIDEQNRVTICYHDCVRTNRKKSLSYRLGQVYNALIEIIAEYKPNFIAVEDVFYSENIKTAIVMSHARGVSLLASVNMGIEPAEYSPREIKLSVVGQGGASKSQVQFMIQKILNCKEEILQPDAADAIAVALCHYHRLSKNYHS
jgi:crossover junction endodeoxyribonuclease RuvC